MIIRFILTGSGGIFYGFRDERFRDQKCGVQNKFGKAVNR
jgi:hypothetical protein